MRYIFILILVKVFVIHAQNKMSEKEIDSLYHASLSLYDNEGIAKMTELHYIAKNSGYIEKAIPTLIRIAEIELGYNKNYDKCVIKSREAKKLSLKYERYDYFIFASSLESHVYVKDKNNIEAHKTLDIAYQYLPKIKDIQKQYSTKVFLLSHKIRIYEELKLPKNGYIDLKLEVAKEIYKTSLLILDKDIKSYWLSLGSIWAAEALITKGNLNEAEKYINIAIENTKHIGPGNYMLAHLYKVIGDNEFYNSKNTFHLDSAKVYYLKTEKECYAIRFPEMLRHVYPKLAEIYEKKKDFKNQLKYLELNQKLVDSLIAVENNNINLTKSLLYGNKTYEDDSHSKLYFILIILIPFALFFILKYNKRKTFTSKKIQADKIENIMHQIESKEEYIEQTSQQISHLIQLLDNKDAAFYHAFLEAFPDFSQKLLAINPNLKTSDIEFCAMIKLNLDTKQMARYKNISVRAVEGKKYRIRKKLNLTTEENMHLWLQKS